MTDTIKNTAEKGMQISVFVENQPGTLADVADLLGGKGINIYALTLTGGIDHGYVRLVADKHEEAMQVLTDAGKLCYEREVVLLEIANAPGSLAAVTRAWAASGINLDYAYCAGGPSVEHGLVVMRVDSVDAAVDIVNKM
jgi:hypothetical protein